MTDTTNTDAAVRAAYAEVKPILKSRTIWALVVAVVAWTANKAGAHIGDAQINQIVDLVTTVAQGGAVSAAALFRVVASKPLN
jgi:hypothetical protein